MSIQLLGVNHKSAPVEVRERLAVPPMRLGEAAARLARYPGIEEGMILSTCNRVEMVAAAKNGEINLRGFLADYFAADVSALERYLYEYSEHEAIRHVFRVSSSLDSMIVGEPQILGQVKEAYAVARQVGAVGPELESLFTRAFAVAKRVRNETAVGSSAISVASAAVELAKEIFGSLAGKQVYLVGAGKMSELAARHLLAQGAAAIFVANRTHQHALALAERFQGQAILFEELYETADRADIVITSTGAPHAIFRREHGERFLQRRKNRPMFFIDIAVPRDVDAGMSKLDGIFVYDIDDLQSVVNSNMTGRRREAERANRIIDSEVEKFSLRLRSRELAPTIVSLQEHLETIRQAEVDKIRGRLGRLTSEQELAIEALTRGIVNKVLHTPITTLKSALREPHATTVIELVQRMFNLPPRSKPASKEPQPEEAEEDVPRRK